MRQTLATLFVLSALTVAVPSTAAAQAAMSHAQTQDLVIAAGEGLVKRAPDQAFVTVAAEARSRQPREAQAQNAKVASAIRERLSVFNLPADALRTLSVDMQPEFDWANGKQTLRGYLASNVIEVRLDDVARVGEVVDAVIGAGATRVTNVRFTLKDMAGAEQEALKRASAAALARARAMAEGVGRSVDRVVRLDETGRDAIGPQPVMMRAMAAPAAADMPTTPVTAGEVEVRVSVTLHASLK
ncbi:SIMPL domain-containing protein [Luteitalea sp. TBR-22]|uniref:SIMPL domain-containing protein n=1 Tax=Luteitalea sp. TBR-22 TaxID=2802971 RepID=UPI001EF6127E|nr:SIMPL domain-containing protein [Luteitalea sp. TBR-22]